MNKTEFSYTNEAMFDKLVFGEIFPDYFQALKANNLENMYTAVLSYHTFCQHFLNQKKSEELFARLTLVSAFLGVSAKTRQEQTMLMQKRARIRAELITIWKEISNELHKIKYFKRSVELTETTERDKSALQ